jgi:tRNA1(Val) A37 N6-methylase TrmN6
MYFLCLAGAHVLVAGGGTGVLALMSSIAPGVAEVTALERSKSMFGMAKLAIKSNRLVSFHCDDFDI